MMMLRHTLIWLTETNVRFILILFMCGNSCEGQL